VQIKLLPLMVAAVLSGCSLAPDYHQPDVPSTQGWQGVDVSQTAESELPDWRTFMPDERLQSLIELALANNKNLKTTLLNVASLRATYRIQDAERYPGLNASGSGSRTRFSDANTGNGKSYTSQYKATVGVTSYELDLFGRVQSLSDQALESYLSQDEIRPVR
jgi:multidrug efflux system outer membrane protein